MLAILLLVAASASSGQEDLDRFVVEMNLQEAIGSLERQPIRLSEALDEALEQSIEMALARADAQSARDSRWASDASLFPSVEVGLSASSTNGRVQGSFGELRDVDFNTRYRGAALVYRANIAARLKEAFAYRQSVQAAQFDQLNTEQRLILRVVELYQDLLLAGVAVDITHDVVEGSEQFRRLIQARASGGLAIGADVARAEAKLAVDRQELIRARNELVKASTRLAVVLRRDVDVLLVPFEDRLAPSSFAKPSTLDPLSRPDVQAADRRAEAAGRLVSSAKWELYSPELRAELRALEIGESTDNLEGGDESAALVLWNLSPVAFGHIRERRAEESRAQLELAEIEDRAAGEIRRAEEDLAGARDRIPLAGDGFRAANDTLRLSEARFRAGTAIALEVLDAQDVLAQARFNLARAIIDYNSAQAHLLAASGTLDRSSILANQD